MKLRRFDIDRDFDSLSRWAADERTHAMWCAMRMKYPLQKDDVDSFLRFEEEKYGNKAFTAVDDNGCPVGFFCCSPNRESGETMLKFVIVDPECRGKGFGSEMVKLAAENEFADDSVRAVQLMVFTENTGARRCYEKAGFAERSVTPDAFTYGSESWGRCNMVLKK